MLEFSTSIPRSGGMKVYSKRSFSPKLLFTCIYLFYCAILRESRPNSVPGSGVATDHLIEI